MPEIKVFLYPYDIHYKAHDESLIIRYRVYNNGVWSKNGFLMFKLPVHEQDIYERVYIQFGAAKVTLQLNYLLLSEDSVFYS